MQEKMASRNPVVRGVASAVSHIWFPLSLSLARLLPRKVMHALARQTISRYMQRRSKYVGAVRSNLAVILGRSEDSPEVREASSRLIDAHFFAWVDFLHFASRPPETSSRLVESVVGYSRILDGLEKGNGVLLLTAHLGNWEVGGLMLAEMKQPIHVVLVPDIFPAVEGARRRLHERAGVTEIPVVGGTGDYKVPRRASRRPGGSRPSGGRSFLPTLAILRALGRNAIVAMQGDRDFDNSGCAVPFFGMPAFFPRGPIRVAMATGATVLPAFIIRVPDGRYRAVVEEPLSIERGGDREAAFQANLRRYVAILEKYVAAHPEQWYCFYPFWDDPSREVEGGRWKVEGDRYPT